MGVSPFRIVHATFKLTLSIFKIVSFLTALLPVRSSQVATAYLMVSRALDTGRVDCLKKRVSWLSMLLAILIVTEIGINQVQASSENNFPEGMKNLAPIKRVKFKENPTILNSNQQGLTDSDNVLQDDLQDQNPTKGIVNCSFITRIAPNFDTKIHFDIL